MESTDTSAPEASYEYLLRRVEGVGIALCRRAGLETTQLLQPRRDLFGAFGDFDWGYKGAGPKLLSASLLAHYRQGAATFEHPPKDLEGGEPLGEQIGAVRDRLVSRLPEDEDCEVSTEDIRKALGE